jgi:hypothetical protein
MINIQSSYIDNSGMLHLPICYNTTADHIYSLAGASTVMSWKGIPKCR